MIPFEYPHHPHPHQHPHPHHYPHRSTSRHLREMPALHHLDYDPYADAHPPLGSAMTDVGISLSSPRRSHSRAAPTPAATVIGGGGGGYYESRDRDRTRSLSGREREREQSRMRVVVDPCRERERDRERERENAMLRKRIGGAGQADGGGVVVVPSGRQLAHRDRDYPHRRPGSSRGREREEEEQQQVGGWYASDEGSEEEEDAWDSDSGVERDRRPRAPASPWRRRRFPGAAPSPPPMQMYQVPPPPPQTAMPWYQASSRPVSPALTDEGEGGGGRHGQRHHREYRQHSRVRSETEVGFGRLSKPSQVQGRVSQGRVSVGPGALGHRSASFETNRRNVEMVRRKGVSLSPGRMERVRTPL